MESRNRRHTGRLVRGLFQILMDHPEGLPITTAVEHVSRATNGDGPHLYEDLMRGCVAAIKAGWLSSDECYFVVSQEGRVAYQRYSDPEDFLVQAGKLSFRGWISIYFPQTYFFLGKLRDQFASEYRVVKRIGVRTLLEKAVGTHPAWQEMLPVQSCRRIHISNLNLAGLQGFLSELSVAGLTYAEGGHAVYLPPQTLEKTPFRVMADYYPPNSGLKIVKHRGGISESVYVSDRQGESMLHLKLIHNLRHLTLVANLLHASGVGPRLYDLVELECDENVWTAFIVDHVGTAVSSMEECEKGIEQIRELERKGLVKVILPLGFNDQEFQCPDCSGNAFRTTNGEFRYVDFQNFALINYGAFLKAVAVEAATVSHFGDKSILRGGRYLYQSVPGVNLPGKRSVDERMKVLTNLMERADMSVQDRLVLDIGCNIGMMMAQYLKLGAVWCHGWDRESVVSHAEKLLLALGCTRFSFSGGDINKAQSLEQDLTSHLKPHLQGCVISYLAIRGHIGWLDSLPQIPWSFLIYEGHEGETGEQFTRHFNELNEMVSIRVAAQTDYADGDSEGRTVAILIRD